MSEQIGCGETKLDVAVKLKDGQAEVRLGDKTLEVARVTREGGELRFACDGQQYCYHVRVTPQLVQVTDGVSYYTFPRLVEGALESAQDMPSELTSQMPGTVLKLLVEPGSEVAKGTPLLILEAMKMEHEVCAPTAGVVEGYPHAAGTRVMPGDLLVRFTPAADQPA